MNTMGGKESQLLTMLEPTVGMWGYDLWGLELLSPNRRPTLRVYIDKGDGVTVDDCASVSRHISGVLDVEDPFRYKESTVLWHIKIKLFSFF